MWTLLKGVFQAGMIAALCVMTLGLAIPVLGIIAWCCLHNPPVERVDKLGSEVARIKRERGIE